VITLDRPDLTAADLDGAEWLAVKKMRRIVDGPGLSERHEYRPPDDVLALLEPCEECGGTVHVGLPIDCAGTVKVGNHIHVDQESFVVTKVGGAAFDMVKNHDDCVNGRPKFQIVVPCQVCEGKVWIVRPHQSRQGGPMLVTKPCTDCNDGTVSRTFTVTGNEPLLPVVGEDTAGSDECIVRRPDSPVAEWWWMKATPDGWNMPITVVGLDEHTTHVLRITAVPA
jgi:hypothetical protein